MRNKLKIIIICIFCFCLSFILSCCSAKETKFLKGSAVDIMTEVRKQISFPAMIEINSFSENGRDTLKNYYGIKNTDKIKDFSILLPQEDVYTEVAIFKIDPEKNESYDIALKAVEKRFNDLYNSCKVYEPDKLNRLENQTLIRYKNAVIFIVNDENENRTIKETVDRFAESAI